VLRPSDSLALMSSEVPSNPPEGSGSDRADELADRLVERRERLAYFLITSSTAIIAFTVTQLGQQDGPLRNALVSLSLSAGSDCS
jgi:hypothetical protein